MVKVLTEAGVQFDPEATVVQLRPLYDEIVNRLVQPTGNSSTNASATDESQTIDENQTTNENRMTDEHATSEREKGEQSNENANWADLVDID